MSAALRLYEQLTEAKDDKTRARLIAEAFDELEARFPQRGTCLPGARFAKPSCAYRRRSRRQKAGSARRSSRSESR
jgi:hypothetical protein